MINWVELVMLMKEVAVGIAIIVAFLYSGVLMFRWRHEFSDKCYLPWEKEDKKRAKLQEKKRR